MQKPFYGETIQNHSIEALNNKDSFIFLILKTKGISSCCFFVLKLNKKSPQPQSMDTTVGQDMNGLTNIAMLFLVFFLRKKNPVFIGKWEFCIALMKISKELQNFPKKGNIMKDAFDKFFNNN